MERRRECDVCVLLHGDRGLKMVTYCGLCESWLCRRCQKRYDLRAIAAIKQKANELLARLCSKEK